MKGDKCIYYPYSRIETSNGAYSNHKAIDWEVGPIASWGVTYDQYDE